MYMTASRIIIDNKPVLKLMIHEFAETDIAFLDSLGIDQVEGEASGYRFILIHSQDNFRTTRGAILEEYRVVEEKGPRVLLEKK